MARSFSLKKHIVTWGELVMSHYADGDDVVRVTPNAEDWILEMGADGLGTFIEVTDKSGIIEVDLAYVSPLNQLLSAKRALGILGIAPFIVKDIGGTSTLHMAEQCIISKRPAEAIGKKPGKRTWTFITDVLVTNYGGAT